MTAIFKLPILINNTGEYINPTLSVDHEGRITSIANGSGASNDYVSYIGATGDVNLGPYSITGNSGNFSSLDVTSNSTTLPIFLAKSGYVGISSTSYRNSPATHVLFEGKAARGSYDAPLPINSGDSLFRISAAGWDGSSFYTPGVDNAATIDFKADSNFSSSFVREAIITFEVMASGDNFRTRRGHVDKKGFKTNYAFNNIWLTQPETSGRLTILESGHLIASGTTNISGTNTGDITLSGSPTYLTLNGQVLTKNPINLSAETTGILPNANTTATSGNSPNTLVLRDSGGSFGGTLVGNASTATQLATPRFISLSGDITGSGQFDGSTNISIPVSIPTGIIINDDINDSATIKQKTITAIIDGGGSTIASGQQCFTTVPYSCVVNSWRLIADQSGSIVIDVWKDSFANYPPTVADSIAGSEKPTLSSEIKAEDTSLTTWSSSITAGDTLMFSVDSASGVQNVQLTLNMRLT